MAIQANKPSKQRAGPAAFWKSESWLRTILEHSYDAIVLTSAAGQTIFASPSIQRVLGYSPEEYLALNGAELVHPDDLEDGITFFRRIREQPGGTFPPHYTRFRHKDGSWRWIEYTATNLLTDPSIGAIVFNFRDITERKQAEEQLAFLNEASTILASSLDYQTTLSTVARLAVPRLADWCAIDLEHDGTIEQVAVFHPDQEIIAWSKQVQQMHQPALNTTVGVPEVIRTGKTLFFPLVTDAMLVAAAKSEAELALMRKIGVSSCMIVPLRLQGKVFGTMTFSFTQASRHYTQADVGFAEAVASRAALAIENAHLYRQAKEAREQLEIILQSVADGIIVYNQHHQIIYANEAAAHLTGFSSGQAMLETLPNAIVAQFELIDEQGHPFPLSQLPHRRVLAGEQEAQAIIGYRKAATGQAERWSLSTARPVLDEQGRVILAISIVHDMTERLLVERRKDEFISMASHELKTPVTSLKGFTHILQRRLSQQGDDQGLAYLAKMDRQLNKLTNLISELLDISRIQTGKLAFQQEAFDLCALVEEIVENLQQTTRTHQLCLDSREPVLVVGDRERMGQVLINLVTNAIKYSPQADKVIVHVARDQNHAFVSVQDFGIGIAKEHHQHIFERFYQVTDPGGQTYPGLGIGLYLSGEIISRHGGHIWVESTKGKGSTFYMSLPLTQEAKETSS